MVYWLVCVEGYEQNPSSGWIYEKSKAWRRFAEQESANAWIVTTRDGGKTELWVTRRPFLVDELTLYRVPGCAEEEGRGITQARVIHGKNRDVRRIVKRPSNRFQKISNGLMPIVEFGPWQELNPERQG